MRNIFIISLLGIFTLTVNAQTTCSGDNDSGDECTLNSCESCIEDGGFYCGADPNNWTSYSPGGCVPHYYLNDGWEDCEDGSDEDGASPTENCEDLEEQSLCESCIEDGGFYCGADPNNWTSYSPDGCVPHYYLNDGWEDCEDGSDEDGASPTENCEESDCSLDFVWGIIDDYISVQAVEFPSGSELTFILNGLPIESINDVIQFVIPIDVFSPITICAFYTSDDCPEGIEFCDTILLYELLGDCIDITQIDPFAICLSEYDPVCGCNNVTYENICEAVNYGGVTSWTEGPCDTDGEDLGCYNEEGVFFDVGSEWFLNDCEYIFCEGPDSWSDINVIDNCLGCYDEEGLFYELGDAFFFDECSFIFCESPNTWSETVIIPDCEGLGCYSDNGAFYEVGEELMLNECEYIFCENPGNWSELQIVPGCGVDCDITIEAWSQSNISCGWWTFQLNINEETDNIFWDFGDGTTGSANTITEHLYENDGVYLVSAIVFTPNCELVTAVAEIVIEGCDDVPGDLGCYNAEGVFFDVGSEWFLNDCEYFSCEGPNNWSDVITIEDCVDSLGCYDEEGVFYALGANLFFNACEYIYCEAPNDWSDVNTIEGCVNDLGCLDENGIFYEIGYNLFINDCEYMFCESPGNWSGLLEVPGCNELNCEFTLNSQNNTTIDCANWTFVLDLSEETENIFWDFGDGNYQDGGISADYTYNSSIDTQYVVTASILTNYCGLIFLDYLVEFDCNIDAGCYNDNYEFYSVGDEQMINDCEYIYCEGPGNWSSVQTLPGCEGECDDFIVASPYDFSPCTWIFEVISDGQISDLVWEFGDGIVQYGDSLTLHDYSMDGFYPVTVTYWSFDCGIMTLTTEIEVYGCGNDEQGCYDDNGIFYLVGEELFLNECEYIYCEGPENWSAVQTIPDCGVDCTLGFEWFPNPNGDIFAAAYDYPEGVNLIWTINGDIIMDGVNVFDFNPILFDDPIELCVFYESADCGGIEYCEIIDNIWGDLGCYENNEFYPLGYQLFLNDCEYIVCEWPDAWSEVIEVPDCGEDDCTIEFDGEVSDGYGGFEAWDYPEGVNLHWYVNGEFYAEGIYMIELADLPPNQYLEVCVGYMTEDCGEVFSCETYYNEDGGNIECTIQLDSWTQGGYAGFEAYDYPEGENLVWYLSGEFYAEGVNYIELFDIGSTPWLEVCVGYTNEECGDVFVCDTLETSGGMNCPDEIFAYHSEWNLCSWDFAVEMDNPNGFVEWDFGDGTAIESGPWATHDYVESGVYTVSAFYSSPSCPNGVELHVTIEVWGCNEEADCINEDQIEENFACTEEYAPVCGCDEVTYSNHCYAYFYHGITSWVEGECTDAVNDFETTANWKVYPVPTADGITLKDLPEGVWTCKMYDSRGRNVMTQDVLNGERLGLETLEEGWYTIQIVGIAGSAKRVIVQR
jgi:hypothetical protein